MFTRHDTDFATIDTAIEAQPTFNGTPQFEQSSHSSLTLGAHALLETPNGWTSAHDLRPGDSVATLDGGFTRIAGVAPAPATETALILIPAGALDNCTALIVPDSTLIGTAVPEICESINATYASMPAKALLGWRGITRAPNAICEQTTLTFAEEEMVWTQTGTLLHTSGTGSDPFFPTLTFADSASLLPLLDAECASGLFSQAA